PFVCASQIPGQASAYCVRIVITKDRTVRQKLWAYSHPKGQPELQRVERGINAYLIDGPRLLVKDSRKPLSPMLPRSITGLSRLTADTLSSKQRKESEATIEILSRRNISDAL